MNISGVRSKLAKLLNSALCILHSAFVELRSTLVGLDGLEPSTSRLSGARSNHLSYKPLLCSWFFPSFRPCCLSARTSSAWWRWWDSNPWPPACRAGALPTELHPHNWVLLFSFFQDRGTVLSVPCPVLALSYFPGPLPAKYFRHCRA